MTVDTLFYRACTIDSDINEHCPHFADLVHELQAVTVIELGVRHGVSTVAWLYGLERTDGHLWSVDINPAPPSLPTDRWTFIQGDDLAPAVVAALPDEADIVFIDTSHTYQHTLDELATYLPKVRDGGRIVLHDTEVETPDGTSDTDFPVKRAVEQFCAAHGFGWANWTHNNGLGVITVRRELPE